MNCPTCSCVYITAERCLNGKRECENGHIWRPNDVISGINNVKSDRKVKKCK